ncbi:MAG: XRE family transcriptional regulator [Microthrixaceae bacterium]
MTRPNLTSIAAIFNPYRLTQAREMRALTKHALAESIEVSPALIGQYESGRAKPGPENLARLALALGMPLEFFAHGRPTASVADANFRSLRSTTRAQRRQAIVPALLAAEIAEVLAEKVRLPTVNIPHLELPPEATSRDVEDLAEETRAYLGLGEGPVPHMVRLLESLGIIVTQIRAETKRVSAFSCPLPNRPVVVLSTNKVDKARSRMDAAHEFGHLVMHHEPDPGSQMIERQANIFAAAFLMPRSSIQPHLPRRLSWNQLLHLKEVWGISLAALLYRSRTLGVISEAAFRRAMVELGKHTWEDGTTWRTREPGDLGEPESPVLLRRALEVASSRGTTLETVADRVCLPIDLVADIIGTDDRLDINLREATSATN